MKFNYSKIKQGWLVFASYFYLYIVVGNVIGEILVRLGSKSRDACYPYWNIVGQFNFNCQNTFSLAIWETIVGIPRFLASILYGAIISLRADVSWNELRFITIALFLLSILVTALIFIPGFLFWKKRSSYITWIATIPIIIIILYFGLFLT